MGGLGGRGNPLLREARGFPSPQQTVHIACCPLPARDSACRELTALLSAELSPLLSSAQRAQSDSLPTNARRLFPLAVAAGAGRLPQGGGGRAGTLAAFFGTPGQRRPPACRTGPSPSATGGKAAFAALLPATAENACLGLDAEDLAGPPPADTAFAPDGLPRGVSLPAAEALRRWTLKESLVKATGTGLICPPGNIPNGRHGQRRGCPALAGKDAFLADAAPAGALARPDGHATAAARISPPAAEGGGVTTSHNAARMDAGLLPAGRICGTLRPCRVFHLVTLFPEFFRSPLEAGLMGRARQGGPRDLHPARPARVQHGQAPPCGRSSVWRRPRHGHAGGAGGRGPAVDPHAGTHAAHVAGGDVPFTQALARELAQEEDITLICGRYEGLDARLNDLFPLEPVSVGEAVLNGGECAALAVLEAVARLMPGYMGKEESGEDESFSHGLLEYPHYTRPEMLEGLPVPDVLRSGDHIRIARWRREESLKATLRQRPDLLAEAAADARGRGFSGQFAARAGRTQSLLLPAASSGHAGREKFRHFFFDKSGHSRYSPDFAQLCNGTVLCGHAAGRAAGAAAGHPAPLDG